MENPYKINLDIKRSIYNPRMEFVQGDTDVNVIEIILTKDKEPMELYDKTITLTFKKPDGNVVVGDGIIVSENIIKYDLGTQETSCVGQVIGTVEVYQGNKRLTSKQFYFHVIAELGNDTAIESSTEYPILTSLINDVQGAVTREDERRLSETERKENEIKRVQLEQELEALRIELEKLNQEVNSDENIRKQNEIQRDELKSQLKTLKTTLEGLEVDLDNLKNEVSVNEETRQENEINRQNLYNASQSLKNDLEQLKNILESAIESTITATNNANNAANSANLAATLANEKATLASSAINSISTLENEVTQAENLRKQNETSRQDAEVNRVLSFNSYNEKIIKLEEAKVKKYGARRVLNADTPILERLGDAVGLVANAGVGAGTVVNNFDSIYPWSHIRNCIRTSTGRIVYQGEPGYELTVGDWLVEIPKFYLNIVQTETHRDTWISEYPIGGFVLPNSFKKEDGTVLNKIYVPRFKLGIVDGVAVSRPGLVPATVRTLDQFRTLALAKGPGWQLTDMMLVGEIIHPLYMVEFAHLNSQLILGSGITSMRYTATDLAQLTALATNKVVLLNASADQYAVGQIIGIGTSQGGNQIAREREILAINTVDASTKELVFDGDPVNITAGNMVYNVAQKTGGSLTIKASSGRVDGVNGKSSVKYRNMEDIFMGNVFEWIDGMLINDHSPHLCTKPSKYSSSITSDYVPLSYTSGNTDGYVRELGIDTNFPFAQLPISVGAGTSTGYCDYYYRNTGLRAPFLGGNFNNGSFTGLWYWYCYNSPATSNFNIGARLLYRG